MADTNQAQEEVTTVSNESPRQVIKKTTSQVAPQVKMESPQKVFDKKKTIFRSSQILWYVLGLIEVLLGFRFFLKLVGADASVGFTRFIYGLTEPLAGPFNGVLQSTITGVSTIEWSTAVAAAVYLCIAWGIAYLLGFFFPITPEDVSTE